MPKRCRALSGSRTSAAPAFRRISRAGRASMAAGCCGRRRAGTARRLTGARRTISALRVAENFRAGIRNGERPDAGKFQERFSAGARACGHEQQTATSEEASWSSRHDRDGRVDGFAVVRAGCARAHARGFRYFDWRRELLELRILGGTAGVLHAGLPATARVLLSADGVLRAAPHVLRLLRAAS